MKKKKFSKIDSALRSSKSSKSWSVSCIRRNCQWRWHFDVKWIKTPRPVITGNWYVYSCVWRIREQLMHVYIVLSKRWQHNVPYQQRLCTSLNYEPVFVFRWNRDEERRIDVMGWGTRWHYIKDRLIIMHRVIGEITDWCIYMSECKTKCKTRDRLSRFSFSIFFCA